MSSESSRINGQFTKVSGGTSVTLIANHSGILNRVLIGGTFVGTIEFYDSATLAGTAASNSIWSFGDPTHTFPIVHEIGVQYRRGLVYTATGTPLLTIVSD